MTRNKIFCIAIDLINADKPPASLAFLAGACEVAQKDYNCASLNSIFLASLNADDYNKIYSAIKLNELDAHKNLLDPAINRLITDIKNFNSDTILVTVFSFMQHPLAVYFLEQIAELRKSNSIEILIGGPGVSFNPTPNLTNGEILLKNDLVDYYCLGEGDEVILKWLCGENNILGINGKSNRFSSWVSQIDNLDTAYLIPSYKKIPTENYKSLEHKTRPVYSISTSRGCVRNCSFCDIAKSWPKFRFRSGKKIAEEILKHHNDVGAVNFQIVDSLINGSLKSFRDFNLEMIQLKQRYSTLRDFTYNGMFIVRDKKSHTESFFATIKAGGCESITIGVETGSDRLRFEMNKKFTNEDLDYHLEMCQKYEIKNFLLTFVGYPTETAEDYMLTLNMLERYQKYLIDGTIQGINHSGIYVLLPNTPVFDHATELGISIDELTPDEDVIRWFNYNNPSLTVKERILRDLLFRKRAAELRYPIPYADRYLNYIKKITPDFTPMSD